MQKMTFSEFKRRAKEIHGDKYKYDKVNYKNNYTKIKIGCRTHGYFIQEPKSHLKGYGCQKCVNLMSKEDFILKSNIKHKNFYNYNKVEYKKSTTPVIITCPVHGDFKQKPDIHLQGSGCHICGREKTIMAKKLTKEIFVKRANLIHNNFYKYDNVHYTTNNKKVLITCPKHGDFKQLPSMHLSGFGCIKCRNDKQKLPFEVFVNRSNKKHNYKYTYGKNSYITLNKKVKIKCPIHGWFNQRANTHMDGSGCSKCNISKGEKKIAAYLKKLDIRYIREYKIQNFNYRYDFYLPDLNILIEYDGEQHFRPVEYWGGIKGFEKRLMHDKEKSILADANNMYLIRIPYTKFNNIEKFLNSKIRQIYKYEHDGKYFKRFIDICNYFGLPEDTTLKNYKERIKCDFISK